MPRSLADLPIEEQVEALARDAGRILSNLSGVERTLVDCLQDMEGLMRAMRDRIEQLAAGQCRAREVGAREFANRMAQGILDFRHNRLSAEGLELLAWSYRDWERESP